MTFEQLRTFQSVADEGTFTRAAAVLFMSQPAVSQHVQALERSVGQRLFDRRGRSLALTVAGERLLAFTRLVLRDRDALLSDLGGLDAPLQGTVVVGAIHSVGTYVLPTVIAEFQRRHPSVRVELKTGSTEQITEELGRGALDLAVLDTELPPSSARAFTRTAYGSEAFTLIVPPDHPWRGRTDLTPAALEGERFVMRERRSRSRAVLEGELEAAGVAVDRLTVGLELGSTEAIKQAVRSGLGVGVVPASAVAQELAWGALGEAALAGGPMHRALWLYAPARSGLPRRVKEFQAAMLEAV
jgi:DNA-binding transcriptional LysR family regulator